jgi:signal transduction histidine kinase/ActR/RegA family two-component response regulator
MRLQVTKIAILDETDIVKARQRAKHVASLLGFDSQDQTRIATAVSEIARNSYEYAQKGMVSIFLMDERPQRLFIEVQDQGKGIGKLQDILEGRYKSPTGLGLGLIGARKLMDFFTIESSGEGTKVTLAKLTPKGQSPVTKETLKTIIDELTKFNVQDPLEEMRYQNQELMAALTLLREKQDELRSLNVELENTNRGVLALYSELDEKASALQTANQVKTRFLSNVTHEFRTPVNSISNVTRILLDELDGSLADGQKKSIEIIERSAKTLSDMVNDLLDLAKVEAGKITVRPTQFNLADLFSSLNSLFKPLLAKSSSVHLVIEEPEDNIEITSDEAKLSQILRNLISNALKFTERGEVRVSAEKFDGRVTITVADTGIGIAQKDLNYIFDEFVQIESPLQRKSKGTGLGLPLTRKLTTLLGGFVHVRSELGLGSTFSVNVPLTYLGPLEASFVSHKDEPSSHKKLTILVIDDDPLDRQRIKDILISNLPCEIIEASSGLEGINSLNSRTTDLVFLDIVMPETSGWDILEKLRRSPVAKSVPVIMHTAQSITPLELELLSQKNARFLSKQATENEKLQAVRGILREQLSRAKKEPNHVERHA